jgi:hypothetical protein
MCLFEENCKYSIKKILTYAFSLLAFYVVIFTDREVYEILLFIAALLGIRGYERVKLSEDPESEPSPEAEPVPEDELGDDSVLGVKRTGKRKKRRLLTD